MGDFAVDLFLHSPVPSIVICHCKRVLAANLAIEQLLHASDLPIGHSGRVCGTDCLQASELDKWKFTIEGDDQSWDTILERCCKSNSKVAKGIAGYQASSAFVSFQRPRPKGDRTQFAEVRHDSPIEESFPSPMSDADHHTGGAEADNALYIETVRAKVTISSWMYGNEMHYTLAFYDTYVVQQSANERPIKPLDQEAEWLKKCRHAIFDSVPLVGYIVDAKGETLHLNKLVSTLAGGVRIRSISKDEGATTLYKADFSRKLHYEELPGVVIVNTRKELEPFQYGQVDLATGRSYLLRGWGSCLYDSDNGEFLGAVVFSEVLGEYEDTIERTNIERLRSFETICDTMPHFVWTADENGYGEWFSSQWLEYTGMPLEQSIGWGWKQTIHPEDLDHFTDAFRNAHDQVINYEIEVRCRRHDGVYRWMLKRGSPIKDSNGNVLLWTGTNTEIHDTVVARIRARHERDQMVRAMEHAHVNVWAVDKRDKKLSFVEGSRILNEDTPTKVTQHGAITAEQLKRFSWTTTMGGAELELAVNNVLSGNVSKAEMEVKWMNRWHKVWIIPDIADGSVDGFEEGEVRGVVGCSIDITDEKMRSVLESDNKQLSEEKHLAKEQSRMKSKFLANMSHEIRTPVAGVIGLANLLLDSDLDDEQRDHAEAIQMSAQTLLMIVNDILDFSKVESGKLTLETIEFNLSTLVTNLWKVMHYSAHQKSIDFSCELDVPSELCLHGDPGRIRQILTNLVSNAIKFTQRGSVKLTARMMPGSGKERRIMFLVEDTGIGIDQSVLASLFRPFQQGDSSTARLFGGSGLGLSISRSLASLMQGSIELSSKPASGTCATFTVPLPVVGSTEFLTSSEGPRCLLAHHIRPKLPPKPASTGTTTTTHDAAVALRPPFSVNRRTKSYNDRKTDSLAIEQRQAQDALKKQLSLEERSAVHILLAEDNAVNRLIAIRAIQKLGFSVSAVWNGQEALEYLLKPAGGSHRRADVVLMDCQMPVMDGYWATRTLRSDPLYTRDEHLRRLPVIAMTASAITGDREKCYDAGMSDYLAKPVDAGALEAMLVKWVLSRRSAAGAGVHGLVQGSPALPSDYFGDASLQFTTT